MRRTNRELLDLSAKAAGIVIRWERSRGVLRPRQHSGGYYGIFDPLNDSDAALRLVVDLRMRVEVSASDCKVYSLPSGELLATCWSTDARDIYEATRRAIVMAAAEVGATADQVEVPGQQGEA